MARLEEAGARGPRLRSEVAHELVRGLVSMGHAPSHARSIVGVGLMRTGSLGPTLFESTLRAAS